MTRRISSRDPVLPMPRAVVLIGFAEALAAPEAAWSLVDEGFRVIGFARRSRRSPVRQSRSVEIREITGPEADFEASISDLHALLTSLDAERGDLPKVLLPLDDASVLLCSSVQPRHPEWHLAGPQGSCIELALNKRLQTEMARHAGFQVPESWSVVTSKDVTAMAREEVFPIILKAAECARVSDGQLQKGRLWICGNRGELEGAAAEWNQGRPLLAQRFVTGTGEGVFGIATSQGIRGWSAHRRLRMMNPHGSGSSACVSKAVESDVQANVEKLIALSGWRGLFMIELLRDVTGKLWFVELNGRPWGSTALSRRQGLEYPAWQVRLALGEEPVRQAPAVSPGLVCRHVGRELMHVLFVLRGPKSRALSAWPSRWRTVREIFRIRRGDRVYNWRWQDPMVFFFDCYCTFLDNVLKSRS